MGCVPSKTHPFTSPVKNEECCVKMSPIRTAVISSLEKEKTEVITPSFTDPRCSLPTESEVVSTTRNKDAIKMNKEAKLQESTDSRMSNFSFQSSTSKDSGVCVSDEKYPHVITEFSDQGKVQEVAKNFHPKDQRDLIVKGKALCKGTSSDKEIEEEQLPAKELVLHPETRASGGESFDLIPADVFANSMAWQQKPSLRPLLPPIRIQRRIKKKKKELTREEIAKKLEKAEERRKQQEEDRLARLATKDRIQKVTSAELEQAERNRQRQIEKMEASTLCRQQHLSELRERLRARAEHHSTVRQRKLGLMSTISVA